MPVDSLQVLVIEDDADTRANLCDILEMDGYGVATAESARAALARKDWGAFSAIILDRRLPDGRAEELLPKLRALAPHAGIIIVTGYAGGRTGGEEQVGEEQVGKNRWGRTGGRNRIPRISQNDLPPVHEWARSWLIAAMSILENCGLRLLGGRAPTRSSSSGRWRGLGRLLRECHP